MDNPFLPALVCFGPFFAILLFLALDRRAQERKRVPPARVAAAFVISLGIGIAGAAALLL